MRHFKKKSYPLLEKIEIIDAASEGHAVAKVDELVIFVSNAVPGDVADLQILHKKKNFAEAKAVHFHKYSEKRVEPFCIHFGTCGGCKWQNMNYEWQLYYKQKQVEDNLKRLGKFELPSLLPILASEETRYYRNKLEYTFSNKKWLTNKDMVNGENPTAQSEMNALGFHIPKRFDKILDVVHCYLQEEPTNSIRLSLKEFAQQNNISFYDLKEHTGLLRNLIIRTSASTGEVMVIVCFSGQESEWKEKILDHIAINFPEISSLMYVNNHKKNDTISDLEVHSYKGKDHIMEVMKDLQFKIGPKSFFQTNSKQALNLYNITLDYAQLTGNELVYDLYTGTGTIANFVAKQARHVVGVEYIESAIEDAKINSALNNITNTSFFAGDMKDVLSTEFINENGKPDVIITDPPRAGMHTDVVNKILEINPNRIVYVSCNAATQARDITLLAEQYQVIKTQPVDMFPQTHHVENVILLEKIN
jgi:23S rRNA (uracil1939-C5)-methyltransferase